MRLNEPNSDSWALWQLSTYLVNDLIQNIPSNRDRVKHSLMAVYPSYIPKFSNLWNPKRLIIDPNFGYKRQLVVFHNDKLHLQNGHYLDLDLDRL